jgi:hypothetical protein
MSPNETPSKLTECLQFVLRLFPGANEEDAVVIKNSPRKKAAPKNLTKKNPRSQRYAGAIVMKIWDEEVNEDPDDVATEVYVSFGTYDAKKKRDSFGVHDDKIFFYCEDEDDLLTLASPQNGNGWYYISYELIENERYRPSRKRG